MCRSSIQFAYRYTAVGASIRFRWGTQKQRRYTLASSSRDQYVKRCIIHKPLVPCVGQEFCRIYSSGRSYIGNVQLLIDCFRLHRTHEMQTIVTDVLGVCLSLCPFVILSHGWIRRRVQCVRGHSVQPLPNYFGFLFAFSGCPCSGVSIVYCSAVSRKVSKGQPSQESKQETIGQDKL